MSVIVEYTVFMNGATFKDIYSIEELEKEGFTVITDRHDRNILDLKKRDNSCMIYSNMGEFIESFEKDIREQYGEHPIYEIDVIIDKIRMNINLNSDE